MAIDFQRPEYKTNIERWNLVKRVCSYVDVEQYLIELNPHDNTPENVARNKAYRERAVFYAVAGYTLQGLVGLMFNKDPNIKLPSQLEYMLDNVDGSGVSIYQQAQDTASDVIQTGRDGLFVSYPKVDGPVSKSDMDEGGYVATINEIEATQIINWATEKRGAKTVLSLVVFAETAEETANYETKTIKQIRELALKDNIFIVRSWRKNSKDEWIVHEESTPTDAKGNTWSEIPFVFVGSNSNTHHVDDAPLYPLAKINIAHYRNSADYEDSVWYVGQSQPWMSGINQMHVDLMKDNNMYVGSRSLIGVPSGETFGFAAAEPNPLVRQAMLDKLDMMVGLGARFIQENGRAKTATEDNNDEKAERSTLSLISANVSEAYTKALNWAARYMGAPEDAEFKASTQFTDPKASAQDLQQMVAGFVSGAIPMGAYFKWLQKVGIEDGEKTVEEFSSEISAVSMPDMDE